MVYGLEKGNQMWYMLAVQSTTGMFLCNREFKLQQSAFDSIKLNSNGVPLIRSLVTESSLIFRSSSPNYKPEIDYKIAGFVAVSSLSH